MVCVLYVLQPNQDSVGNNCASQDCIPLYIGGSDLPILVLIDVIGYIAISDPSKECPHLHHPQLMSISGKVDAKKENQYYSVAHCDITNIVFQNFYPAYR